MMNPFRLIDIHENYIGRIFMCIISRKGTERQVVLIIIILTIDSSGNLVQ